MESIDLVRKAFESAESATSLQGKSAAVRKHVPWEVLKMAFFWSKVKFGPIYFAENTKFRDPDKNPSQ
jgi:hypothetical protein